MPTYEYKCAKCSHAFEQFQSMKDKPLRKCPKCGKSTLERLIGTGAAVIFKGSGFYQTDYRSEAYKKSAEAESKPAAETKTDGKAGDAKATPDAKPAESKPAAEKRAVPKSEPAGGKTKGSKKR